MIRTALLFIALLCGVAVAPEKSDALGVAHSFFEVRHHLKMLRVPDKENLRRDMLAAHSEQVVFNRTTNVDIETVWPLNKALRNIDHDVRFKLLYTTWRQHEIAMCTRKKPRNYLPRSDFLKVFVILISSKCKCICSGPDCSPVACISDLGADMEYYPDHCPNITWLHWEDFETIKFGFSEAEPRADLRLADLSGVSGHSLGSDKGTPEEEGRYHGEEHHDPLGDSILESEKPTRPIPPIWHAFAIIGTIVAGAAAFGLWLGHFTYRR